MVSLFVPDSVAFTFFDFLFFSFVFEVHTPLVEGPKAKNQKRQRKSKFLRDNLSIEKKGLSLTATYNIANLIQLTPQRGGKKKKKGTKTRKIAETDKKAHTHTHTKEKKTDKQKDTHTHTHTHTNC